MYSLKKRGFTLIELLVVVAIIALLISILLPSLSAAREEGKKATCLANMRSIAQGFAGYSTEDRKDHAVPIHQQNVNLITDGFNPPNYYSIRGPTNHIFGGRTPTVPFMGFNQMMDENGKWAARTRPLNKYIYGAQSSSDSKNMPLYKCPSDSGPPDNNPSLITDVDARVMSGVPYYDFVGNSYRINPAGVFYGAGNGGSLTVGPYGHKLSTLQNTGKVCNIMEPQFYSMVLYAVNEGNLPPELLIRGWHRKIMSSNVGFVDGSARVCKVSDLDRFTIPIVRNMGWDSSGTFAPSDWRSFLRRGQSWQMDCYPTPGAWVDRFNSSGVAQGSPPSLNGWPGPLQRNMDPPF